MIQVPIQWNLDVLSSCSYLRPKAARIQVTMGAIEVELPWDGNESEYSSVLNIQDCSSHA